MSRRAYNLLVEAPMPPKSAGCDHRFVRLLEDLGQHQPGLEFWNTAGRWVPSGIITGRVDRQFVRRYRVKKPNKLQELLGHKSLETTEIYLHCIKQFVRDVTSPLDVMPGNVVPFAAVPAPAAQPSVRIRTA